MNMEMGTDGSQWICIPKETQKWELTDPSGRMSPYKWELMDPKGWMTPNSLKNGIPMAQCPHIAMKQELMDPNEWMSPYGPGNEN